MRLLKHALHMKYNDEVEKPTSGGYSKRSRATIIDQEFGASYAPMDFAKHLLASDGT